MSKENSVDNRVPDDGSAWESDWESDVDENDYTNEPGEDGASSDSSASSDGNSDKCPICLFSFTDQEIGTPDVCDHAFCSECIEEWSKNVSTCPIDRKVFASIKIFKTFNNKEFLRDVIIDLKQKEEPTTSTRNSEDLTFCEVCNSSDREDCMLLCDGCDGGYHMYCLIPPLDTIPTGSWYCDNCFSSESEASEDDINNLLTEAEDLPTRLRARLAQPRMVRTRQSERIRATIVEQRTQQGDQNSSSTTRASQNNTNRVQQRKKKRKTKTKWNKRKGKKKRSTRRLRKQISALGGRSSNKPTKKIQAELNNDLNAVNYENSELQRSRIRAGIVKLNITTPMNDLNDYISDDEVEMHGFGGEFSGGLLMAHNYSRSNNITKRKFLINEIPSTSSASSALDLLNNILQDQERWHSKDGLKDLVLEKNGSIKFNKPNVENARKVTNDNSNGKTNKSEPTVTKTSNSQEENSNTTNQEPSTTQNNINNDNQNNATNSCSASNTQNVDNNLDTISSSSNSCNSILNKNNSEEDEKKEKKDKSKDSNSEHSLSDEDDDTCPNFSVYSLETMELAKISEVSDISQLSASDNAQKSSANEKCDNDVNIEEEYDVDLVQLGDDDDDDDILNQIETATSVPNESNILNIDNTDNLLSTEIGAEMISDDDENIFDEIQSCTDAIDENETSKTKSVESTANNNHDNHSKSKKNKSSETFKKISKKLKDRNYRDKDKPNNINTSSSKSYEKTKYYDKYMSDDKKRNKRNDMERYDVKMVIAEKRRRSYKDQFGRDRVFDSRSRSRSSSGFSSTEQTTKRKRRLSRSITPIDKGPRHRSNSIDSLSKFQARSRTKSLSYENNCKKSSKSYRKRSMSRESYTRKRKRRSRSASPNVEKSKKNYRYADRQITSSKQNSSNSSNMHRDREKVKQKQPASNSSKSIQNESKSKNGRSLAISNEPQNIEVIEIEDCHSPHTPTRITSVKRKVNIDSIIKKPTSSKNLTVILTNEENEYSSRPRTKKKEKKSKLEKKQRSKRNDDDQELQPTSSKEVFTSGDNILISLNFGNNKDRNVQNRVPHERKTSKANAESNGALQSKKNKHRQKGKKENESTEFASDLIIDLNPSPFEIILDSDEEDDDILEITETTTSASVPKPMQTDANKQTAQAPSQQKLHNLPTPSSNRKSEKAVEEQTTQPFSSQKNKDLASQQSLQTAYDPFEPTKSPSLSPEIHRNLNSFGEQKRNNNNDVESSNKVNPTQNFALESEEKKEFHENNSDKHFKSPSNNNDGGVFNKGNVNEDLKLSSNDNAEKMNIESNDNMDDDDYCDNTMDIASPYSPGSNLIDMPQDQQIPPKPAGLFEDLFGESPDNKGMYSSSILNKLAKKKNGRGLTAAALKSYAPESVSVDSNMHPKDLFIKKLNRQERVVEEVKLVIKPHYNKKNITKEEYKEILRRAVPKICHSKSGEINPQKIKTFVEAYVKKMRHKRKDV